MDPQPPETAAAPREVPADAEQPSPGSAQKRKWLGLAALTVVVLCVGLVVGVLLPNLRSQPTATESPGVVLDSTPAVTAAASPSPGAVGVSRTPTPALSGSSTYTVQPGDTMKHIAATVYGDPDGWAPIYEVNRDRIGENPDSLTAGLELRIPSRPPTPGTTQR